MALPVKLSRGVRGNDLARNDFNTMLNRLFTGGLLAELEEPGPLAPVLNYGVDIREDEDHIFVDADLPGFRKEEIDIALENGMLTITAEHREETTDPNDLSEQSAQASQASATQGSQQSQPARQNQDGKSQQARATQNNQMFLLRERHIQRYVRAFTLPPNVDESNVQAKYENGVLHITLNKREESKPKRVQVS
jgi:HSP20 family protein